MPNRTTRRALLLVLTTFFSGGCSDQESLTDVPDPQFTKDCTFFNCGTDPEPGSEGIFLGNGFTPTYCYAAASDKDQDGLDNLCEDALAEAFRPEMVTDSADDTRGEVYWAAQRVGPGGRIRIAYLLGYYWDHGSPRTECAVPVFPPEGDCGAHFGDSEWVAIDVEYVSNGRWRMYQGCLSAHFDTANDHTKCVPAGSFHYPEIDRGFPRVFASLKKHANYESQDRCNVSIIPDGKETFDECFYANPLFQRVEFYPHRNIGSRTHNARSDGMMGAGTCRFSEERFVGNGFAECFWIAPSGYHFNGWQSSYDVVKPYEPQLAWLGF